MKTVTLWNVPLEVAKLAVKELRAKASQILQDGAPTKEVIDLMWTIDQWEDEIRKEEMDND